MEPFPVLKRDLALLYLSMLVTRVGFGVIIITFPLYIVAVPGLAAATALALYPTFEAATALPLGRLCDSVGRKKVFSVSLGFMALMMASVGLTRNFYAVSSIHALMGVGAAGITVSTLTMITDLTGRGNRGAGMGAFDMMNVGGYAVGLFLGSRLDITFRSSLGSAFYVTGAIVAVAFAVALIALKEPPHAPRARGSSLNPLSALDSRAKAVLPIWLGVTIMLGMVFFLPYAFANVGISGTTTAGILVAGVLLIGMASVGFGALSDVIGRTKVLLIGTVGLMGLLLTLSLALTHGVLGLYRYLPFVGVFGLATSALVPTILALVGDQAAMERRGSAMGLYSVMLSGGTAIGTLVAGESHKIAGLAGIFRVATVIFVAACLTSLVLSISASRASRHTNIVSQASPPATAGVAQPGQRREA